MTRWDEILSLPVQSPSTSEFSSADLVWSKVEGWRDNMDRVALIPFARVDDFVRGESSNKDCPTKFHVEARRRRPPNAPYKAKVDGILEYILYWCSFGPDDHRKGGVVRPSRSTYIRKKKFAGRPNTKRGCTCHFIVKRLIAEPSVALLIYNQDKHVDKLGSPCHGPQDQKAAGTRAMFAPYISEDLLLRVYSLLYVGVSVEAIMQRHNESVERQGGPCNRDDLLTHRYVRRQERSIRRSTYELDTDDAISLSMWVESHQSCVFFYQDFSENDPFTIGIQTEWQLQQMIRFGNRSLLVSDSRFGMYKLQYPVHSLLVFNSENKAIPIAWVISPRFTSVDSYRWMRALYNRVLTKDSTWKLAGFIVDDPSTDVLVIKDVFQCSVLISTWRIRHAWHKNLMNRCSESRMRIQISKHLGQAMCEICKGNGTITLFDDLMKDFSDSSDFMEYFKAVWYPRLGAWISALKSLPLASQETSAAIEFYHSQLKIRLLNEKTASVCQRVDWLVDKLATKVHSYFWLDEYPGKGDFARYWKDEWLSGLTSWRRALEIPDSDVKMEGQLAKVVDLNNRDKIYYVSNPGSEFAICNCSSSEMGNLCAHVFKLRKICQKKGSAKQSISFCQYKEALMKMLQCPPNDSITRDYAVSLASFVRGQLGTLTRGDQNEHVMNEGDPHLEQPGGSDNQVENVANKRRRVSENTSLVNHNDCGVECDTSNNPAEEGVDNYDPSSIVASPSGLFTEHGILHSDIFSGDGERTSVQDDQCKLQETLLRETDLETQISFEVGNSDRSLREHLTDTESESTFNPLLAMEPPDPCTEINQYANHGHGALQSADSMCIDETGTTPTKSPASPSVELLPITNGEGASTETEKVVNSHLKEDKGEIPVVPSRSDNAGGLDGQINNADLAGCLESTSPSEPIALEVEHVVVSSKEHGQIDLKNHKRNASSTIDTSTSEQMKSQDQDRTAGSFDAECSQGEANGLPAVSGGPFQNCSSSSKISNNEQPTLPAQQSSLNNQLPVAADSLDSISEHKEKPAV